MEKHISLVKSHFDKEAKEYNLEVIMVIPGYKKMHKEAIKQILFSKNKKFDVLDIGVGTGNTSLEILKKYKLAKIDGLDVSKKMIDVAKSRLSRYKLNYLIGDIKTKKFTKKYDVIISTLTIHHLKNKEKTFKKIYSLLKPKGIFILNDIFIGNNKKETNKIEDKYRLFLKKNFGDKKGNWWINLYSKEDIPDSINNQILWLNKVGFKKVELKYKYLNTMIIVAKK